LRRKEKKRKEKKRKENQIPETEPFKNGDSEANEIISEVSLGVIISSAIRMVFFFLKIFMLFSKCLILLVYFPNSCLFMIS
jgi:hypothetical protein